MSNSISRCATLVVVCFGLAFPAQQTIANTVPPAQQPLPALATPKPKATATGIPKSNDDKKAIQAVLDEYKATVEAKDAEGALSLIDQATLHWYGDALNVALTAKPAQLRATGLLQRLFALRLRNEFVKNDLKKLTSAGVFQYAIQAGWIDASLFATFKVANVKVQGNQAQASLQQRPLVYFLSFTKEDGVWKLAFAKLIALIEPEFKKMVRSSDQSEEDFIRTLIEASSRNTFDEAIFQGPLDKATALETNSGKSWTAQDADQSISITLPSDWRTVTNLKPEASIQAANAKQEKYLLVIRDEKYIVDDLDAYAKVVLDAVQERGKLEIGKPIRLYVNGLPARQYEVVGLVNGIGIVFLYTFIDGKNGYYQVIQWTMNEFYPKREGEFKKIAGSFKEV